MAAAFQRDDNIDYSCPGTVSALVTCTHKRTPTGAHTPGLSVAHTKPHINLAIALKLPEEPGFISRDKFKHHQAENEQVVSS